MANAEFLIGKREIISIGKEAAYGDAAARTVIVGLNANFTPTNENDWQEVTGSGIDSINSTYEIGQKIVRGTLEFVPHTWEFLIFALGTCASSSSAPTIHTFTNANTVYSFALERAINATTDRVRTYEGCQCNRLTINWRASPASGGDANFIKVSADVWAEDVINGTSITAISAPDLAGFQARMVTLTLNNSAKTYCISGSFTVDNNLSDGRYAYYTATNTRFKGESQVQKRKFSGEFTLNYTDDTEFDFWDAGTIVGTADFTGTATASDATSLTDSGSAWTPSEYIGFTIRITGGTGAGQVRLITANTTEKATVNTAWAINPGVTSTFTINNPSKLVFTRTTNDLLTVTFLNLRIVSANDPTNLDGHNVVTLRWTADDIVAIATDINDDSYVGET